MLLLNRYIILHSLTRRLFCQTCTLCGSKSAVVVVMEQVILKTSAEIEAQMMKTHAADHPAVSQTIAKSLAWKLIVTILAPNRRMTRLPFATGSSTTYHR
jgi:hypothetical protein